jgi:hypothetical protein
LKQLADRGVRLAVESPKNEFKVRQVLVPECACLISYYACCSLLFGKQHKFRKAMVISGVKPTETLCVGYEIRETEAAYQAASAFEAVGRDCTSNN